MAKVFKVAITSCSECPNMDSNRHYTDDSFVYIFDWKCKAAGSRHIVFYERPDKEPPIPDWCPLDNE